MPSNLRFILQYNAYLSPTSMISIVRNIRIVMGNCRRFRRARLYGDLLAKR
jgi:hypothetical protein